MAQSITREQLLIIIPTSLHTEQRTKQIARELSIMLSTLVELHGEATSWSATESVGVQTTYVNPQVFRHAQDRL